MISLPLWGLCYVFLLRLSYFTQVAPFQSPSVVE